MKKILNVLLIMSILLTLVACNLNIDSDAKRKLTAPTLSLDGEVLSWTTISKADRYELKWDLNSITQTATSYDLKDLPNGEYYFKVKAISFNSDIENSDYSKVLFVLITDHDDSGDTQNAKYLISTSKTALTVGDEIDIEVIKVDTDDDFTLTLSSNAENYVSLYDNKLYYYSDVDEMLEITLTVTSVNNPDLFAVLKLSLLPVSDLSYPTSQVNVFTMNDTHGSFNQETTPGIDQVASVIEEMEANNGVYIKVANGDIFQGGYVSNIHYGLPLMEALNDMNFDCFVIGNHEFDWGIDKISVYKDGDLTNGEANYPFLGANIIEKATSARPQWLDPYVVVNYGGYKVGIIGFIGENLESSISAEYIADYEFIDPLPLISDYASYLRTNENCDIVIASGHTYDTTLNDNIAKLSGNSKIDLIICGHTHTLIHDKLTRSDGKKIAAVQCDDKNDTVTSVILHLDNSNNYTSYDYKVYYPSNYTESLTLKALMDKYLVDINESTRIVGYASYISKERIGQYCLSAMKDAFGCDINIINTGGVRKYHASGNLTVGEIYEIYPFSNHVYITTLTGSALKSLMDKNGSYLYYDLKTFDSSKTYTVGVIDYVYTGVYYTEFKGTSYRDTGVLLRDLLVQKLDEIYN